MGPDSVLSPQCRKLTAPLVNRMFTEAESLQSPINIGPSAYGVLDYG